MIATIHAVVPVVYVSDVEASVSFYRLLGFDEVTRGDDGHWAWAYLRCGALGLLLGSTADGSSDDRGPVQMYCQTEQVAAMQERLGSAGAAIEHLGYPDHAPGGEVRVPDPDGHVIMIGQTTGAPHVTATDATQSDTRTSILQRAAEAVRRRGGTNQQCQVGEPDGSPCRVPAEVKLADSWGDTAWSCIRHAEEVVLNARGVYLANEDAQGLTNYLSRRRRGNQRPRRQPSGPPTT